MKYKVAWYDFYETKETIVEAESKNKATYKVFKSLLGNTFDNRLKFNFFLKYFYKTTEIIESEDK